jgi:hypothetical protein
LIRSRLFKRSNTSEFFIFISPKSATYSAEVYSAIISEGGFGSIRDLEEKISLFEATGFSVWLSIGYWLFSLTVWLFLR